jgi:Glycosyl hydrolases family 35.
MKDSGITVVSTYVFWNYHQTDKNSYNFDGDNDIAAFSVNLQRD